MNTRTHEEFIEKLDVKHPDREWKVLSEYEHNTIPLLLEDKYGKCLIPPNSLLQNSKPSIKTAIDKTVYTKNRFLEIWGDDMFDYSEFEYNGVKEKSTIICKARGHNFLSDANNHLSKRGCPECAREAISGRVRSNTKEFVEKAIKKHNNFFSYPRADYKGARVPLTITCPKHGDFEQEPNSHLSGYGCTKCARENITTGNFHTVSLGKKCTFYLIECWDDKERFLKVGVTSNTVQERFKKKKSMPYKYKILKKFQSFDPEAVTCFEWECLNITNVSEYDPLKRFHGYTECRNIIVKDLLIEYIEGVKDIEKHKSFTLTLMGKDKRFNKRYKELTGVTHIKGMGNFNEHLRKQFM